MKRVDATVALAVAVAASWAARLAAIAPAPAGAAFHREGRAVVGRCIRAKHAAAARREQCRRAYRGPLARLARPAAGACAASSGRVAPAVARAVDRAETQGAIGARERWRARAREGGIVADAVARAVIEAATSRAVTSHKADRALATAGNARAVA